MKIPDFLISKFNFAFAICDISAIHPVGERQQLPLVFKFEARLRSEEFCTKPVFSSSSRLHVL